VNYFFESIEGQQKTYPFQAVCISSEVDLDEMEYNPEMKQFQFLCRCGSFYCISEEQLEKHIDIVQCQGCSLHIKVLYSEVNVSDHTN
jgi:hypothetical protein